MITTVCLNPAVDRTVSVAKFVRGGLNRVISSRTDAGGKGVNVAVTLSRLGEAASAAAFLPEGNAKLIEDKLASEGVALFAVRQAGAVRTNLKLLDESLREITEVNESGPSVTPSQLDDMRALIAQRARQSDMIVFSGSLPPGCPADFYRELIAIARESGCMTALDADANRLREGLKALPDLIKPNRHELEELTGHRAETLSEIDAAARSLTDGGIKIVAVSMGGDGAYITDGKRALYAGALAVTPSSTVGAGDAMLAGLAAGLRRASSLEDAFRLGMACGAASVTSEGTGLIDRKLVMALYPSVDIHNL